MREHPSPSRLVDSLVLSALAAFAFGLCYQAGTRGLYAFDQSIAFDGAYRVVSGQVPYKDFHTPFGPMLFWVQAIFFKLLGVSFASYVIGAATLNALATILAVGIVRGIFPSSRFVSYGAGLLTAVWFYAPSGTPMPEQTAFVFVLLAAGTAIYATLTEEVRPWLRNALLFLAGLCQLLAFLTKQNAGLYFVATGFLIIVAATPLEPRTVLRRCVPLAAGFLFGAVLFAAWIALASDYASFHRCFFETPSHLGSARLERMAHRYGEDFVTVFLAGGKGKGPLFNRLAALLSSVAAAWTLVVCAYNRARLRDSLRRPLVAALLCLYLTACQYVFVFTTSNQAENCFPFIGIIFALGIALWLHTTRATHLEMRIADARLGLPGRRGTQIILCLVFFALTALIAKRGVQVSMSRVVQDLFANSGFPLRCTAPELSSLKWGDPTPIIDCEPRGPTNNVTRADIDNVLDYLRNSHRHFFVFPDFTLFYGLLGAPSPQPILWFHKGLTYPKQYDEALDQRIVAELKQNHVEIVVLERVSVQGTTERLDDFPLVKDYIQREFQSVGNIGIFARYEKRPPEISSKIRP